MNNIQIFKGKRGICQAYEQSLKTKHLDIQCLSKNYHKVIGDYFDKVYAPKLYSGKIKIREIIKKSQENADYAKKAETVDYKIKLSGDELETDLMIGDKFVIFVSYDLKNLYAVQFFDSSFVKLIGKLFETRWKIL